MKFSDEFDVRELARGLACLAFFSAYFGGMFYTLYQLWW